MAIIQSHVDTGSKDFAANDAHMHDLVADLQKHLDQVELGGGEKACKKHTKRGKMLPRKRIKHLIDPGTPFLELSIDIDTPDLSYHGKSTLTPYL